MSSKLDAALEHAAAGFLVFPLVPGGKVPLLKANWREIATGDSEQIKAWWSAEPNANIGIKTDGFLAVDVDLRHGGKASLDALFDRCQQTGDEWRRTRKHKTWSDGQHIIYRTSTPVRCSQSKIGQGLDVKGNGGYLVAPGSMVEGKPYTVVNPQREIAAAPQWLIDLCEQATVRSSSAGKRLIAENEEAVELAQQWLEQRAPEAHHGVIDGTAYWVAARFYDFGVSRDTCRELLSEWSYSKSFPPMAAEDIERVSASAEKNRLKPIGYENPKNNVGFEPVPVEVEVEPTDHKSPDLRADTAVELVLSLKAWAERDLPEPEYVSGRWLTTTSRTLLVAPTGLGKSMLAIALGMCTAAGRGFLHWVEPQRAMRVLYIDGEMSRRLLKRRLAAECRRLGAQPDNFYALSHEDIPNFQPLNTPAGRAAIEAVIKTLGGVDLIIFDNIMSLIAGDQKEEEGWAATIPWVKSMTARGIGQLWIHHTGHDESRSYGTKTREWQLDTVIHLTRLERPDTDVSMELEFRKARERTPENRGDFVKKRISLAWDTWQHEDPPRWPPLTEMQQAMFQVLAKAGPEGLTTEEWNAQAKAAGIGGTRRATLVEVRAALITRGLVAEEDGRWRDTTPARAGELAQ